MKISQYYAFAVIDIVAPWNRPQERRCMPGLQGPQPSFMSKIPICECFKDLSINIRRQSSSTGLLRTFGERKSLGQFPWTMNHLKQAVFAPQAANQVVRSRKALRPRSLTATSSPPSPSSRSSTVLVGRSPWLPLTTRETTRETMLETMLETTRQTTQETTRETTRRQLQVKCYRSTHLQRVQL